MKSNCLAVLAACLGANFLAPAYAKTPADGPYRFTGTATIISGPTTCINGSPASIAGDAVSSGHGRSYYLHIRASSATYAFGAQLKSSNGTPVTQFGTTVYGNMSYLLLPSTDSRQGSFASQNTAVAGGFDQSLTIVTTTPLTGTGKGTCEIGLSLTLTPGISKPLLKLFQGVL